MGSTGKGAGTGGAAGKSGGRVVVARRASAAGGADDRRGAISKALSEDNWNYGKGPNAVVEPPFKPNRVCEQVNVTQALRPVIDAVVTNVHLMGDTLDRLRTPEGDAQTAEAAAEKKRIERWFRSCNRQGWPEMRKRFGKDKETIAYALFELLRNLKGELVGISHRPSRTFRMTTETEPVEAVFRVFDEEAGDWAEVEVEERFHRWVQNVGGQLRYFKEYGDPRIMDHRNGEFMKKQDGTWWLDKDRESLPKDKAPYVANEVVWSSNYDPMSEYGMPWFMGLWNDTESDYQASDATRDYLADGAVPRVVFVFRALQLTGGSMKEFKAAFEGTRGNHAENRAVLLEAAPMKGTSDALNATPESKSTGFDVVKLNDLQQGDALFRNFRKDHEERVRVARRLPGIFMGKDDQANYATATVQVQMGISQVFRPEQQAFDTMVNAVIMAELGAKWWRFRSLGPTLEDNATWVSALNIAIDSGAIPNYEVLRAVLEEVLGYKLPSGDKKGTLAEWEKMPPGFVKLLFQAVGGYPAFADLADVLPMDGDASGDASGKDTPRAISRSAVPRGSAIDRLADVFIEAGRRARERLLAAAAE